MPEDRLIDPAWLVTARKNRKAFALRVAIVFGILSVLAWWALPRLQERHAILEKVRLTARKDSAPPAPALVTALAVSAGVFKVFWVGIVLGCAAGVLLGFTGKIDTLLPLLNFILLLVAAAALALTFYVFYAPALLLLGANKLI
jgi:hypothetical protein